MGLIDLDNLKPYYDSDRDDVLNDFYIPVLKESVDYWRLAGFFSSTALAVASRGIKGLLNNNGRIKLVAGAIVHPEDVAAIREGIENPLEVIERNALENLNSIREEFIRNHVRALGWLVARNRLDIRMAIVKDNDGLPLDSISINKNGIFHQKVGIFEDAQGQKISFSGSINETKMAWCNNIEEFKVFREWADGEKAHFQSDQDRFIKYWSGESSRVQIMEMPEVIRKNLIRMAPEDIRTIDLSYPPRSLIKRLDNTMNYKYNDQINKDINNLRDYQCTAIKKWKENRYKGILEMATASGKTFTAIIGSYCLYKEIKKLCTIVLVPSRPLVTQWGIEIRKYSDNVVMVSSEIKNWKAMIQDLIFLFDAGYIDHFYVVSTIQSYIGNLSNYFSHISSEHILLVADEAHWLGASQAKSFMGSTSFKYILGLTATPIRHFDEDGTQFLKSFFGGVIFQFDIKNGQERGYLCNYNYHIKFCNLDSEELEEYISLTKNIVRSIHNLKKNDDDKKITRLLNKRAAIVKDAESKFKVFDDLLVVTL